MVFQEPFHLEALWLSGTSLIILCPDAVSLFEAGLPLAKPVSQQGLTFFPHAHSIFEKGILRVYEPLLFLMHIINI